MTNNHKTMKTHSSTFSPFAIQAQVKTDAFKQHALFRFGVFALSVAAGYFFCRLVFTGLQLLPALGAHAKASPAADALSTLHAGFGN
jgi:hypothetical protein